MFAGFQKVLKEEAAGEQAENAVEHGEARASNEGPCWSEVLSRACLPGSSEKRQGSKGSRTEFTTGTHLPQSRLKSFGDVSEALGSINVSYRQRAGAVAFHSGKAGPVPEGSWKRSSCRILTDVGFCGKRQHAACSSQVLNCS